MNWRNLQAALLRKMMCWCKAQLFYGHPPTDCIFLCSGSVELGGWVTLAWPLPSSTTRTETLWKTWWSWLWRQTRTCPAGWRRCHWTEGICMAGEADMDGLDLKASFETVFQIQIIIIWSHYNNKFVVSLSVSFWIFLLEQVPAWFFHSRAVIFKSGCFVLKYWSGTVTRKTVIQRADDY